MISKKTLLHKMDQAIQLAKQTSNEDVMIQQIQKVHVLAELMIEETSMSKMSTQSMNVPNQIETKTTVTPEKVQPTKIEHETNDNKEDVITTIFDIYYENK